jgi:hypothetical protein
MVADQAKALARKLSALASEIRRLPTPASVPLPLAALDASLPAAPAPLAPPGAPIVPIEDPPRSDYYWTKIIRAQEGTLHEFLAAKREAQSDYASKGTGAVTRKRYAQSEKGKAARKRYAQSEKGREAAKRYAQSDKGKAARQRAQAAARTRKKV